MRTTLWQLVRLCWVLYRNPARKHLRIGQLLIDASPNCYYTENDMLIGRVKVFR